MKKIIKSIVSALAIELVICTIAVCASYLTFRTLVVFYDVAIALNAIALAAYICSCVINSLWGDN